MRVNLSNVPDEARKVLRWWHFSGSHREPDFSSPAVGQLERLTHIELQHPQAPGKVLQGPDDGVLYLRRGPLTEFVMAQVSLQGRGDAVNGTPRW
jgi:hypothetical protein